MVLGAFGVHVSEEQLRHLSVVMLSQRLVLLIHPVSPARMRPIAELDDRVFADHTSVTLAIAGFIGINSPAGLCRLQSDPARYRTRNAGDAWRVDIGRPAVARRMKMPIAAGE